MLQIQMKILRGTGIKFYSSTGGLRLIVSPEVPFGGNKICFPLFTSRGWRGRASVFHCKAVLLQQRLGWIWDIILIKWDIISEVSYLLFIVQEPMMLKCSCLKNKSYLKIFWWESGPGWPGWSLMNQWLHFSLLSLPLANENQNFKIFNIYSMKK